MYWGIVGIFWMSVTLVTMVFTLHEPALQDHIPIFIIRVSIK